MNIIRDFSSSDYFSLTWLFAFN